MTREEPKKIQFEGLKSRSQSRRVPSFFSSRRNWDSPTPSPTGDCAPPPPWFRWVGGTLACGRRGGVVPIPTRRHTLWYWYSIFMYMYFVVWLNLDVGQAGWLKADLCDAHPRLSSLLPPHQLIRFQAQREILTKKNLKNRS
jgi:hypothetical protein